MYAYIDESGNTGKNLFDKNQPLFITAALITKNDFHVEHESDIKSIANGIGEPILHANEVGRDKVEIISKDLLEVFKKCDSRFFISVVDKCYLATIKLVDTLFDSNENKSVAWHVYNFRPLRMFLVFEVAQILTEEIAIKFWNSLLEKNRDKAYTQFVVAIKELKENIEILHNERTKQIIGEAIEWAIKYPKSIYLHENSKFFRDGHLPNLVVFPNLLRGIDQVSKEFNLPVKELIHDRQSQFQNMLKIWHEIFSNAPPDVISWPGVEKFSLQCVANSSFKISNSKENVGIQAIDTVLWLYKRFNERKTLDENSKNLLQYVFENSFQYGLTFEIMDEWLSNYLEQLNSKQFDDNEIAQAKETLRKAEEKRKESMDKFERRQRRDDLNN